jgi:hypothetical protein
VFRYDLRMSQEVSDFVLRAVARPADEALASAHHCFHGGRPLAAQLPPLLDRALRLARVDFAPAHQQPSAVRVVAASVISVAGSLAADAVLVAIGTAVFPSTRGYVHFRFSDYAQLTVIGVVIACLAWPVDTRISSAPRWLFLRIAVLVTLVLWLPDLYILANGESPRAVAVLMVMHLAIAVVTYNCLVRIARVEPAEAARRPASGPDRYASGRM